MNKKIIIFLLTFFVLFYISTTIFVQKSNQLVFAQNNNQPNPTGNPTGNDPNQNENDRNTVNGNNIDIPKGKPPGEFIRNIYIFFLSISGMLAFFVLIWGGVQRVINAGNPEKIKDADEWIKGALWGLLLLFGAWVLLYTINPNLVKLELPKLQPIKVEERPEETSTSTSTSTSRTVSTCQDLSRGRQNDCKNSPALTAVLGCLNLSGVNIPFTTYQGTHSYYSCHFGGRYCTDGSHAFDMGFNALRSKNITPEQAFQKAIECGGRTYNVQCYYEDEGGRTRKDFNFAGANHIHCNVNTTSCGCN
jgi:hypothetical protein